MKTFYGGTFINMEQLKEANIYTPIKLEYYKVKNEENYKENYGIEIPTDDLGQLETVADVIDYIQSHKE